MNNETFLPTPGRVKREKDLFVRLFLYAEPGFGKSYFADQFPDPFVINTDGNLPYYTAPGLIVNQWEASKNHPEDKQRSFVDIVEELVKNNGYGYKTIIVDLIEGVYELARAAKLAEYGLKHESDAGGYGKGYQLVRDPFYATIKKLYSLPLNIVLLSHEDPKTIKDRIGREYVYYSPKLSDTVTGKLTGTGYTLRGYWKGSLTDDNMDAKAKRMLSLSPKDNELHVARLLDAQGNPVELDDIELSYANFIEVLSSLNDPEKVGTFKASPVEVKPEVEKPKKPATTSGATKKVLPKGKTTTKKAHTQEDVVETVTEEEQTTVAETPTAEDQLDQIMLEQQQMREAEAAKKATKVEQPTAAAEEPTNSISDEKKARIEALKKKYLEKGNK